MKFIVGLFAVLAFSCSGCFYPKPGLKNIDEVRYSVATLELSVQDKKSGEWKEAGNGTLFAIGPHIMLTAGHVCGAYQEISKTIPVKMKLRYDTQTSYIVDDGELSIVKIDLDNDLCMLYQHRPVLKVLRFAEESPELGDRLFIFGSPLGIDSMLTEGYYSHIADCGDKSKGKSFPCFFMSTPSFPGNSGSPVLNNDGQVVGVLVAGALSYPHITVGVPLETLLSFSGEFYRD